jgi:uncharacterized membrane protein
MADFCGGLATRRSYAFLVVAIAHGSSLLVALAYVLSESVAPPSRHTVIFSLIAGLAGGLGLILFFSALAGGAMGVNAAVSGVITATVPVIFSFFADALPRPPQLVGFAIAITAIWLIAWTPHAPANRGNLAVAAFAGIGFGTMLVLLRGASGGALWPLVFSRVGSAGIALFFLLVARGRRAGTLSGRRLWLTILALAGLSGILDAGGNLCYTAAALAGRLDVAAVLSSLYPATTIVLAMWLLRERVERSQTVGMLLALGAVVLISI